MLEIRKKSAVMSIVIISFFLCCALLLTVNNHKRFNIDILRNYPDKTAMSLDEIFTGDWDSVVICEMAMGDDLVEKYLKHINERVTISDLTAILLFIKDGIVVEHFEYYPYDIGPYFSDGTNNIYRGMLLERNKANFLSTREKKGIVFTLIDE